MPTTVPSTYTYFDYAATAPLCEEAAEAMAPYLSVGSAAFALDANPNSLHSPGRAAFERIEAHRRSIAENLHCRRPDEIIFTSGATEADNAALFGLAEGARERLRLAGRGQAKPHVIVSAIEHDAVLVPAKRLEARGFRVTRLTPDAGGFIEVSALEEALDEDTVLVSVQFANSEIGSVQPIAQLAFAAHRRGALFHSDMVQALGKVPLYLDELGVDAASFSAHKLGGPKGIGALYVRNRTPFAPQILGGGQEAGRRSGTQNLLAIAGFAAAVDRATSHQGEESVRLRRLRDRLYRELGAFPAIEATVDVEGGSLDYLPNIVHVLVSGLESETLVLRFDMLGFGVSGGSACSSHSLEPSHVLKALGISKDRAQGALRISMGRYTTDEDVDAFLAAVPRCLDWE